MSLITDEYGSLILDCVIWLKTHLSLDKMAAISQMIFSDAYS